MAKYIVNCMVPVFLNIVVQADDKESAIEAAEPYMHLSSYAGNGSPGGKLVGVDESHVDIEPGDVVENEHFSIEASLAETE